MAYAPLKNKKIKHEDECKALHDLREKAREGREWRKEEAILEQTVTSQMRKRSGNGNTPSRSSFRRSTRHPGHPGWYRALFTSSGAPAASPIAPASSDPIDPGDGSGGRRSKDRWTRPSNQRPLIKNGGVVR
jgi:hypothetical protein